MLGQKAAIHVAFAGSAVPAAYQLTAAIYPVVTFVPARGQVRSHSTHSRLQVRSAVDLDRVHRTRQPDGDLTATKRFGGQAAEATRAILGSSSERSNGF